MKRVAMLLLALLLLSACGRIVPEPVTENPTEIETTTEEATTTVAPTVLDDDEGNEVTWRILDLNSDEGREAQKWLTERYEQHQKSLENPQTKFPMGKDKTIRTSFDTIVLRDNKTGKDTVLLEKQYLGEANTPEEAQLDEVPWRYPRLVQVLDERYFIYAWAYWEGGGNVGVYDTKNMRTIPIKCGEIQHEDWFTGQQLIFADAFYLSEGTYGPWDGPLHLMRVDLKALENLKSGEPLMAADVLADIPGVEDVTDMNSRFVTEDEHYFVLNDSTCMRVYDLQKKKLALELPVSVSGFGEEESYWWPDQLVPRGNIVYWTDSSDGNAKCLVEISL
jgi:hypothetical protein